MDLTSLWDFDDPAGSEQRFREAAATATGTDHLVLMTQVARALGLQDRFGEGHAVLDGIPTEHPEVAVRVPLERGRLFRSAGDHERARRFFAAAVAEARRPGMDALLVDALHMLALVGEPADQKAAMDEALALARSSNDPSARAWEASLLNNLGMSHADAGDWDAALATFEQALAARRPGGRDADVRIARWMVAWALRNLGRTAEALAIQQELKAELAAAGEADPYVDEELALLHGDNPQA